MGKEAAAEPEREGIGRLPRRWQTAVQLVSTFGLAVFLVLYYLLVMRPQEAGTYGQLSAAHNRLSTAVSALVRIVENEQTLVTREQARNLEQLYIEATAHELADRLVQALEKESLPETLAKDLNEILQVSTLRLRGFAEKDGGALSERVTRCLADGEVARELVEDAAEARWKHTERRAIVDYCQKTLLFQLRRKVAAE